MLRELTTGEIALARSIFGDTIDYSKTRIANRRIMKFQPEHGGLCTANTINISGSAYLDDYSAMARSGLKSFFIHEMTHLWQYQKSPLYFGKKFAKEILKHRFNYMAKAYQYNLDRNRKFDDYGLEQQACIVQDYFAWKLNGSFGESRKCLNRGLDIPARLQIMEKMLAPHFPITVTTPKTGKIPPPPRN